MNRYLKILLSFPKTLYFNFRFLHLKQALKLPVWVAYDSYIDIKGNILLDIDNVRPAMIRLGFHCVPVCDRCSKSQVVVSPQGKIIFKGDAHLGKGTKIYVEQGAELILGNNFAISSCSQINCFKKITFGNDIQFSWDCLVMDSDTHQIMGLQNTVINEDREIILKDKIWIGCRVMILKGSYIPSNCVIGAGSIVAGKKFDGSTIVLGNPAKSIKKILGWEI